eukprot:6311187-Pyramimonas_sp.AAC.1
MWRNTSRDSENCIANVAQLFLIPTRTLPVLCKGSGPVASARPKMGKHIAAVSPAEGLLLCRRSGT